MSKLCVLAVLGACGFTPTVVYDTDARGTGSDGGLIATRCHVSDPDLRLCFDFEDQPLGQTIADLAMGHDGSAENVAAVIRAANQQAAGFAYDPITDIGSEIQIAETPDLEFTDHVTFELFLGSVGTPQDDVWPVDNYGEYGLKFHNDILECYAGGEFAAASVPLQPGWHHVACAYGDGKLRAYVDGINVGCHTTHGTIQNASQGMKLGAEYTGGIDDVHIYARTLDSNEIAQRADAIPQADVVCKTN